MKNFVITFILVFGGYLASTAQPAAFPEDNRPKESPPSNTAYLPPDLNNITGITKFNYIRTLVPDIPVDQWPSTNFNYRQTTNYYDGLGRPLQTVSKKAHDNGYDIVEHHVYDSFGRETYEYLPFATGPFGSGSTDGKIKLNVNTRFTDFYDVAGPNEPPYKKTVYDRSSLNRKRKEMMPGRSWVGSNRGKNYEYGTNQQNEVRKWEIGSSNSDIPVSTTYYPAGELQYTVVTDEDGGITKEYRDKNNKVILKKSVVTDGQPLTSHIGMACTYFVYDDLKNLRAIIPPLATDKILTNWNAATVPELCYKYYYDNKDRLIERKLPGKGVEYFVYDLKNRQCLTQDALQRDQGQWAFQLFDALGRPTVSGEITASENRAQMQTYLDDSYQGYPSGEILYHLNNYKSYHVYPTSLVNCKILTTIYYDDYEQLGIMGFDNGQFTNAMPTEPYLDQPVLSMATRDKVTGTKSRILDPENAGSDDWLFTSYYYDEKGRIIQSQSQNIKGSYDINSYVYYFQGPVYKVITSHSNPYAKPVPNATDAPLTNIKLIKTYDRNLGLGGGNYHVSKITQKINTGPDYVIAEYDYDHMGRQTVKSLPIGAELNEYNIRGLLTHINAENRTNLPATPLFEELISYDSGFVSKLYNGNIAGIVWNGSDGLKKAYGYSYDKLNRLQHAEYRQFEADNWYNNSTDYTVSNLTYDLNGNIRTMNQRAYDYVGASNVDMDVLNYNYSTNSNQLLSIEDAAQTYPNLPDFKNGSSLSEEYKFDLNGNLIVDENKKIANITYTSLNKPDYIEVTGKGSINYIYDGFGKLLQKKITENGNSIIYNEIAGFTYKNDTLQYFMNEEGRTRPIANAMSNYNTKFIYDFFIKDHLENVRTTVTAEPINASYLARHEISMANVEQLVFDNIPNVRSTKPGSTDPEDGMAARLDASDPEKRVGTAIMLKVMPGDKFTIAANTFYEGEYKEGESVPGSDLIESLMTTLLGGNTYAGVPLSELPENVRTIQQTLGNPALAEQLAEFQIVNDDPNAPKAHLNYLFFDDKMQLVPDISGSIQVPQQNTGGWQAIDNTNICNCTIAGPGTGTTLIIFIDNLSIGKEVWFDDVHIEHYQGIVLEEDHYYPYGLSIPVTLSSINVFQPKKYQSIELEKSFGLEMLQTTNRGLDPQIGRFNQIDPFADLNNYQSPYVSMDNSPSNNTDPDGLYSRFGAWWRKIKWGGSEIAKNEKTGEWGVTYSVQENNSNESSVIFQTKGSRVASIDDKREAALDNQKDLETALYTGGVVMNEQGNYIRTNDGKPITEPMSQLTRAEAFFDMLTPATLAQAPQLTLSRASAVEKALPQRNRDAGNAFRDEMAAALRAEGRVVVTEVYKKTKLGARFIDIDVWYKGKNVGGIETKLGKSPYTVLQRFKDYYLLKVEGYRVDVVRGASRTSKAVTK